jgi:hypothetical protein
MYDREESGGVVPDLGDVLASCSGGPYFGVNEGECPGVRAQLSDMIMECDDDFGSLVKQLDATTSPTAQRRRRAILCRAPAPLRTDQSID